MRSTLIGVIFLLTFLVTTDACNPIRMLVFRQALGTPTNPEKFNLRGACKPKNLLGGAACICYDLWKEDELSDDLLDFCTRLFDMHPSKLLPKCPPRFFKRNTDLTSIRADYLRKFIFKSASCFINGRVDGPEASPEPTSDPLDEEGAVNKCIMCLLCFKLGNCASA